MKTFLNKLNLGAANVLVADEEYLRSIKNLEDVMIDIAFYFGIVMLIYGGIKFALAFQKMDQQGEHQAVFSIISGGILIGLAGLVSVLMG